jgi:general nucleoside transport system ATP-binding protein
MHIACNVAKMASAPVAMPTPRPHSGPLAAEMTSISKSFFGAKALADVDFDLRWGEVHALLGENGAGKTSLCSVLAGLYRPDDGQISVDGRPASFSSPRDALAAGVGMVYQDFRLVESFTVAENVSLGDPMAAFRLRRRRLERYVGDLAGSFGIDVHPGARVAHLSVGERQRVEILKLLHRDVRILILDEPTSVLTPQEADELFRTLRQMASAGRAIVIISHKLGEIQSVSDRITILRDGRRVGQVDTATSDRHGLARLMIGREFRLPERAEEQQARQSCLSVRDLRAPGDDGTEALRGVSFKLARGEILGVAAIAGNGQRELAETIAGLRPAIGGQVVLADEGPDITHLSVGERTDLGLAYVPEDRKGVGVAPGLPIAENLVLKSFAHAPFSRGPLLSNRAIDEHARTLTQRFDIRGVRNGLPVRMLSGGNLQKVLLAREISGQPTILVAAYPTRGLDLGAVAAVRQILLEQAQSGTGILLMSEDLDELLALSDRLIVLCGGRVVGGFDGRDVDVDRMGLLMAGHDVEVATT